MVPYGQEKELWRRRRGALCPSAVLIYLDLVNLLLSALVCRAFRDAVCSEDRRQSLRSSVHNYFVMTVKYAERVRDLTEGRGVNVFGRLLIQRSTK